MLDRVARSIRVIDVPGAAELMNIRLEGEPPERMMLTKDGSRIVVLHGIPGQRVGKGDAACGSMAWACCREPRAGA